MASQVVLVINCGSSSLKFAVIEPESGHVGHHGLAERLGTANADWVIDDGASEALPSGADHGVALGRILERVSSERIVAVGHRVVHGGERFSESVLLNDQVVAQIDACTPLAPLHNPANLLGIREARARFPNVPQVAVFDTAFHHGMPAKAFHYAVPYEWYERHGVRRYGFHGTSHRFVAEKAAQRLGRPLAELMLVTAHLGNGCSACAIRGGKSVDTTMGLTPLEGLVMGTRSGDVDPNLHDFLATQSGLNLAEITELLNKKSGLLGLSGESNDMRTLLEARERGSARAALAIEVFCYRLAKAVLGLGAGLERIDALVFTGGIGEHAAAVRAQTLKQLRILGANVDDELNADHGRGSNGRITHKGSGLLALVIPTNEELMIAREASRFLSSSAA
ncbi:MAG: acetate kinase [Polyangiaceae bacterium]